MSASTPAATKPKITLPSSFTVTEGIDVTDHQLTECAALFSAHYGVWGAGVGGGLRPGTRVRMNAAKLRTQCLANPTHSALAACHTPDGLLVGHAFATVWEFADPLHPTTTRKVGWVTQLVVHKLVRRHYIATHLLQQLKASATFAGVTVIGLASSHPAACAAAAKFAHTGVDTLDTQFIADYARSVLGAAPVGYIRSAELRGSLFGKGGGDSVSAPGDGVVSSVFTDFYVDHDEPLAVLRAFRDKRKGEGEGAGWQLGELLDGHEFLLLAPVEVEIL
ncbi:hypothetical protein BJ138DRAFT_1176864 [Hygrophoropsis aurantiaca]|uniref:Uncharacterized protein n=1 Tax=Hygrophoropsis aurantiaca TaxID=72124 RepID=A0ACB8ANP7_9AGAM|nr:hypothetical protein BJ138DRAFT_1176864 [Hygrophoropsis aurantiaca]